MTTTNGSDEKALAVVEQHSPEMASAQARVISKFAEGSLAQFTERELEIMKRPAKLEDLGIKPCKAHRECKGNPLCPACQIHEPWVQCQKRLDEAFGSEWAITPAPWNPKFMRDGNIVYREFVLWIRGEFIETAPGSHEEFRQTGNIGDAMESCRGSALVRVCKHKFSTNLELWDIREREGKRKELAAFKKASVRPASPETIDVSNSEDGVRGSNPQGRVTAGTDSPSSIAKQPQGAEPISLPSPSGSAPLFSASVDEWKEAIRNVRTLEALKVVWKNICEHKDALTAATFEILNDMKDAKKKALADWEKTK